MAIWQFSFYLENPKNNKWNTDATLNKQIKDLSRILKRTKGWIDSVDFYGKEDETCISVVYVGEKIEEINFRLDLRTLDVDLFNNIWQFIESLECEELFISDKIIPANREAIIEEIKNSVAIAFLKNPQAFMEKLSQTNAG